jgi:hypothetical protein
MNCRGGRSNLRENEGSIILSSSNCNGDGLAEKEKAKPPSLLFERAVVVVVVTERFFSVPWSSNRWSSTVVIFAITLLPSPPTTTLPRPPFGSLDPSSSAPNSQEQKEQRAGREEDGVGEYDRTNCASTTFRTGAWRNALYSGPHSPNYCWFK